VIAVIAPVSCEYARYFIARNLTGIMAPAMLGVMRRPSPSFVVLLILALVAARDADALTESERDEFMEHVNEPRLGDLDSILERGFLRILTVHNPLFFNADTTGQTGIVAEIAALLDKHLAAEIGRVRSPTIVIIPVSRGELIPALIAGRGDIVMGNLTITPERQKLVDFAPPIHRDVKELIVTGPAAPRVASFDDLVATGVHVRRSSNYYEHLQELNAKRVAGCRRLVPGEENACRKAIPITAANENLEDFDLLDMVNAGVLGAVVVDSHKAEFWEQIFDQVVVHRDLAVNTGGQIAWAMRKNSPQLMQIVSAFSQTVKKGTLLGNIVLKRYLGNTQWLRNALANEDREHYAETIEVIKQYADLYDFDWQIIAAQVYQESRFDQSRRSPAGAVGVMQLMPATASDKVVGIPDISSLDNNIHAGVKYLHWLRETYFSDGHIDALDRALFSFAAYNAGPGNMRRARRRAQQLHFDPDRWFGNVEVGMYRAVSGEPASYVRNIYKYYLTYQGLERARKSRQQALEAHPDIAASLSWERRR